MEAGSDDSFNRMFERDKDDLRELGLVIETVESLDGDIGYLARRDSNRLPPITLDAEEAAALGLAAKVWQQARLAGRRQRRPAEAARGRACREDVTDPYESRTARWSRTSPSHEAAFEPLMLACRDRRPVVFDYRKSNAARPERRQVEPWTLECWRGHWYLAGWDRDRRAERVFRLSRITGTVRSRAAAVHRAGARTRSPCGRPSRAGPGRAPTAPRGSGCAPAPAIRCAPGPHRCGNWATAGTSWRFRTGTVWTPGSWSSGPDVVVLEPAELRADVVDRLRAVAKG